MSHRKHIMRIVAGGMVFAAALIIKPDHTLLKTVLFLLGYLMAGGDVLWRAIRNIAHGQVFDENFLMSIATIGAFFIGEYPEGVAVMLFYQTGELFQSYAVSKSRKSISDLMDIRPDYANVKRGDAILQVDPDEVMVGELIVIKPGEKVPLDGEVVEGSSMLDTSALTGESVPREVYPGISVLSGCINLDGVIHVTVTKEYAMSTVAKILDLVENASHKKSVSENFITRFARVYTPFVVISAVLFAVIPPLFTGGDFRMWFSRALIFLVISCPCALVISVPLGFFGGIGGASRKGILVKGSSFLEALSGAERIVFDKTGTLTEGVFKVQQIRPQGMSVQELLEIAAHAENYSNHPISASLKRAYGKETDNTRISDVKEIPGRGVKAVIDHKEVLAGNAKLMEEAGIEYKTPDLNGTVVFVAVDHVYSGYIIIADQVKRDAAEAVSKLKAEKIDVAMLTGDSKEAGEKAAQELEITRVYTELLPADKVTKVEEMLSQKSPKGKLAFVGDGINDAPVLARADIGIAMGGFGSDAAIEAADIVIMTDEPSKIPEAIRISRKTLRIVKQNIVFSLSVKGMVLLLGAIGVATMWEAVFADVGVAVIAILNSMRALKG